jgi:hypothetical protein
MINATHIIKIWPYGTLFSWIAESFVISGPGTGYPTRDLIMRGTWSA